MIREGRRVTSQEGGSGRSLFAHFSKAMEGNAVSRSSADIAATVGKRRGLICVAFGCNNSTLQGVSLHKFPWKRNHKLAKEWEKRVATTRANWKATRWSRLCSAHFTVDSYTFSSRTRRIFDPMYPVVLEEDAIPTIFPKPTQRDVKESEGKITSASHDTSDEPSAIKRRKIGAFEKRERARVNRFFVHSIHNYHVHKPIVSKIIST